MIEIKNISKSFNGKKDVLMNLSCNIPDNIIYGLVGTNGSGKSTLLRIITSIYKPDNGKVLVDNVNVSDNEKIKKEMVFVPDDLYFYSGYTLKDLASFYKSMYNNFDMSFVYELANNLKLDINKNISSFSKGMKRQCAIICALATNVKYMFFDETFDGIDPIIRNYFKKLIINQMAKQDTTIIMTSHNLRELEDICDNLGLIHDSKIFFESDINSLKSDICKVQISLKNEFDKDAFSKLNILSYKKVGKVITLIVKDSKKAKKYLNSLDSIFIEFLPLTLEEIFIYQMEALGYEFKNVI